MTTGAMPEMGAAYEGLLIIVVVLSLAVGLVLLAFNIRASIRKKPFSRTSLLWIIPTVIYIAYGAFMSREIAKELRAHAGGVSLDADAMSVVLSVAVIAGAALFNAIALAWYISQVVKTRV